jgi:hypothetical protein
MRFLSLDCLTLGRGPAIPAAELKAIFDKVKLDADDFTPDRFKPSTSGQAALFRTLQADGPARLRPLRSGNSGPQEFGRSLLAESVGDLSHECARFDSKP